jgi:hypothetical protein
MKRVKSQAKRKFIEIDRGLFLVRYSGADDSRRPPTVRISLDPSSDGNGHVILHPDAKDPILSEPGTALAVKASARAKLLVEVTPTEENGSTVATVQVEALNPGVTPPPARVKRGTGKPALTGLRVVGHVAGIGDVVVKAGEWMAGPMAPSRIEGFAVQWPDMPEGLEFRYAVKAAQANSATGRMTDAGTFAGTRGKALPLVSLVLELSGDDADEHELEVDALFLGAPAIHKSGQRVMLSGPTGREPLVGLRIGMTSSHEAEAPRPRVARPQRTRSRVRVFSGRSKDQPTA